EYGSAMTSAVRDLARARMSAARRLLAAAAACACVWAAAASAQPPSRQPAPNRLVVVARVHGAHDQLDSLLESAGLVDERLGWSGGDAVLVSLGDLLDRGAESRKVIDLMMRLEREAPRSGGAVHVLLGNHEAMNLIGDLRYVSAAEYAAFAA